MNYLETIENLKNQKEIIERISKEKKELIEIIEDQKKQLNLQSIVIEQLKVKKFLN